MSGSRDMPEGSVSAEAVDGVTEPQRGDSVAMSLGGATAGGGVMLWCGMVSVSLSTVVLLAVLSRQLHHQGFAGLSTLFGLLFIASLIPSGIPLRAASLIADGDAPPRFTVKTLWPAALAGLAISPLLGYALGLPVVAVALIVLQVLLAFPLAVRRGSLIAFHRFTALGANMLVEAALRIALGCLAGLLWSITGLVAGLAVATLGALVILPAPPATLAKHSRPLTPMFDTWFSVVLLGVLVQLDVLLAASGLSKSAATRYDVAAIPSKGVYLVLMAVSIFIFPYVRARASRRVVVVSALITMGLGLVISVMLVVFRHLIGEVLGQATASTFLLVCLGCAMSLAGATGVIVNCNVALGIARPWPPLLLGIVGLLACWLARPTASTFAIAVLAVQAFTLLVSLLVCLRGQRGGVRPVSNVSIPAAPS
jgi:hypothetical protein